MVKLEKWHNAWLSWRKKVLIMVSLAKDTQAVGVSLKKRNFNIPTNVNVNLIIDLSGSMSPHFKEKYFGKFFQNIFGICNALDDDGILPVYGFSTKTDIIGDIAVSDWYDNVYKFLNKLELTDCFGSGTCFYKALYKFYQAQDITSNTSFFGKLFGKQATEREISKDGSRQLVLFITDGEDQNPSDTLKALEEYSNVKGVFIQFVYVGSANGDGLKFLKHITETYPTFTSMSNLQSFNQSQDVVLEALLSDKLLTQLGAK
jgi:hypothetical protein